MTGALAGVDAGFAKALAERKDRLDLGLIERAFEFSATAHRGQKRLSGDDAGNVMASGSFGHIGYQELTKAEEPAAVEGSTET